MISQSTVYSESKKSARPRRFLPTLKSRRRGVYVATFFFLSVIVVAVKHKVNPRGSDFHIRNTRNTRQAVLRTVEDEKAAPEIPGTIHGKPGKCFKHILYDKPVKTGSTAISFAIREYLTAMGETDRACGNKGDFSCIHRAKAICNGTVPESEYYSVLGHLKGAGRELVDCLRSSHYVVTSVREPYERRKSAYLWNRTLNGTHFSIPHTAPFKEFMNRMPRCQLYDYYDGKGSHCNPKFPLEQRVQDIIDRVDEVIDLYDGTPVGPLHKLVARYIGRENESIKIKEESYVEDFDRDTLKEEQILYDRLREKRLKPPNPDRLLC